MNYKHLKALELNEEVKTELRARSAEGDFYSTLILIKIAADEKYYLKRAKKFRKKLKKALAVGVRSNKGQGDNCEYSIFEIEHSLVAVLEMLKKDTYFINDKTDNYDFQRKIKKAISLGVNNGNWNCRLEGYQDVICLDVIDLKVSLKSVLKVLEEETFYG